jgi:Helix-turn-helix domain
VPCAAGQGFVGTAWQAGGMRTAYRCRAYPDAAQQAVLNRTFGCVRVVWNTILAARRERYATQREGTSYGQASAALTAMKHDPQRAWLNEVSCVPLQQALRHQQQAFAAFFARRARYPRFKSRTGRQAAEYTRSACGADVRHLETSSVQSAVKQEPRLARAGIPVPQGGE